MECNVEKCLGWTDWSEWTECSAECGGGKKTKVRECASIDRDSAQCSGEASSSEDCNVAPCPQWTGWSPWSECSTSCGGGKRQRGRECAHPALRNGKLLCDGDSLEAEICNDQEKCPQWSEWGEWSECSKSCGGGGRSRRRKCPVETNGDSRSPCGQGQTEESEECNSSEKAPCPSDMEWSEWSSWSTCSQTCGGGSSKRSRACRAISSGTTRRRGRVVSCEGPGTMMMFCNTEECPKGDSNLPDCEAIGVTMTNFGSFNGRPVKNAADCTWDFFACTNRRIKSSSSGSNSVGWPANKPCCQSRFDACCKLIMKGKKTPTTAATTITTTTSTTTTTAISSTTKRPSTSVNKIPLIDCIWNYNGCVQKGKKPDKECKEDFNVCCMLSMGMAPVMTSTTIRPINDIDLPDLPDFLKPSSTSSRPIFPINDINLPHEMEQLHSDAAASNGAGSNTQDLALNHPEGQESNEFLGCLLRLYQCQEEGNAANCQNVQRCRPVAPVVNDELSNSSDCRWAFFTCSSSEADCREKYKTCSNGESPDNDICKEVSKQQQSYLVPHPGDCTKFFSCESLGFGNGWIAHLMECPETTGFNETLGLCDFMRSLPRCVNDEERLLVREYRDVSAVDARQMREGRNHDVEVGDVGYFADDRESEAAASSSTRQKKCALVYLLFFFSAAVAALV